MKWENYRHFLLKKINKWFGNDKAFGRSAILALVSPIVVVAAVSTFFIVYRSLETSVSRFHKNQKTRQKVEDNIPDMEVKEVGEDEEGNPQVKLQDPNNPRNYAVLSWPKHRNNPAMRFQQDQLIAFKPSDQGSGWLLQDNNGIALAFIPLAHNLAENHRALF